MSIGSLLSRLRHKEYITEEEYQSLKELKKRADRIEGLEGACRQFMWERDIAISQLKELGYGLGQKIEHCEDVISRDAALKEAYPIVVDGEKFDVVQVETIYGLPSVPIRLLQKPLKCIHADCIATCCIADAEMWGDNPKKCPNYKKAITPPMSCDDCCYEPNSPFCEMYRKDICEKKENK